MRVCVVTGGTGGIGRHLCTGFKQAGYVVVALDRQQQVSLPDGVTFLELDIRDAQAVESVFASIAERYGAVHVLINNAAVAQFHKPVAAMTVAEFDDVLSVNLRGAFLCSQAFIRANAGQNYGRIINIASTRWHQNEADWEAYGASKGGLVSLTHTLVVSLAQTPITVNAVSPGWIQTEDSAALSVRDHAQHPSGRGGLPRDVVNACLFLAHEENDFVNGHNLVVDGGMTKRMIYED